MSVSVCSFSKCSLFRGISKMTRSIWTILKHTRSSEILSVTFGINYPLACFLFTAVGKSCSSHMCGITCETDCPISKQVVQNSVSLQAGDAVHALHASCCLMALCIEQCSKCRKNKLCNVVSLKETFTNHFSSILCGKLFHSFATEKANVFLYICVHGFGECNTSLTMSLPITKVVWIHLW